MPSILIPEQKVKSIVDYILNYLRTDYRDQTIKEESYLFKLFGDYKDDLIYDYWKNSVALINRGSEDPRCIETHFFLNRSRFTLPTIHITLSGDSTGADGIGFDRNWGSDGFQPSEGLGFQTTSGREFGTRFQIVITSDSTFDVLIMYHTLMACLIGNNHLLTMNGIQNPSLKGGDIILNDGNNPQTIYARAIFLDCTYSMIVPSFQTELLSLEPSFEGTLK